MANGWRPNPGDTITGRVTDLDIGDMGYGQYPIITVQQSDGESVSIHCFHHTLKGRVMVLKPVQGDMLTVTYDGKTQSADGKRTVHVYTASVEGRTVNIWDDMRDTQMQQERRRGGGFQQQAFPGDDDIPF